MTGIMGFGNKSIGKNAIWGALNRMMLISRMGWVDKSEKINIQSHQHKMVKSLIRR